MERSHFKILFTTKLIFAVLKDNQQWFLLIFFFIVVRPAFFYVLNNYKMNETELGKKKKYKPGFHGSLFNTCKLKQSTNLRIWTLL